MKSVSRINISLFTFLVLGIFLVIPSRAQKISPRPPTLPSSPRIQTTTAPTMPDSVESELEGLLNGIRSGIVEASFRNFFANTVFERDFELSNQLITMTKNSLEHFGNINTYTIFEVKNFTSNLIRITYLTHHTKKQLRWQFLYASIEDQWQLVNFDIDDLRNFLASDPLAIPPPPIVKAQIEKFFLSIKSDKTREGFNDFLINTGLLQQPRTIENFISQVDVSFQEYGKMTKFDLFDNRSLSLDTRLLTYVAYLEKRPLRWQFFYRVVDRNNWELTNLRLDDLLVVSLLD